MCTTACGRSIVDTGGADGTDTSATSSSPTVDDGSGELPIPFDLPPPESSCEAQGGRFTQIGGPWVLLSHVPYHSPAYALVPDDDGVLAIWRGEFFGTNPMPNFLGARASYDGQLLSMVAPIWERPVLIEPAVHRAAEGSLITFCGRFGSDDELASQILDAQGQPLAEEVVRLPGSHCGAARPDGVWTGQVYLFSWIDNSSMQVLLDVGDPQSTASLGTTELALEGDLSAPPRMAVGPEGVLLVVGLRFTNEVLAFELAHDGTVLDSRSLALPPDFDSGSLAVGAHPDGSFSVYLGHRDEGLYHTRVDADGQSDVTRVEGAGFHFDDLLLQHRAGGFVLVSAGYESDYVDRIRVLVTDDTGWPVSIETLWSDDGSFYEAWPAITMHGDEAWVLYVSAHEDETYDVRLAQLGCAR